MEVRFTVPGTPVAQPRQRHSVAMIRGRAVAQNYTPSKHPVQSFKAAVQLAASMAHDGAPIMGPISMAVTFVFPRPKGMVFRKKPMPRTAKTSKPDVDNLMKSVCDALNGLLWLDDAQVFDARIIKLVASGDEQPRTEVVVWQKEWSDTWTA